MTLLEGASRTLTGTVQPSDADQTLIWTSSDEKVAVWEDGMVVAKGYGTADITATAVNGVKASCKVTVNPTAPKFVKDFPETATAKVGEAFSIQATIDRTDCNWELTKDGEVIDSESFGGDFYIKSIAEVAESDAGVYKLKATVKDTNVSTESAEMTLTVTTE